MDDIVGYPLVIWEPILAAIHISVKIGVKLYSQVETNSDSWKVRNRISDKLDFLSVNLEIYATGSDTAQKTYSRK